MSNSDPQPKLPNGAERSVRLARLWLMIERYWPAFWPAFAVIGFYLAFSLFDPWRLFPGWVRIVGLIGAAGAAIVLANISFRDVSPASEKEARRRIEAKSGLTHRPLDASADTISGDQHPMTRALWGAYKKKLTTSSAALKVGLPHAGLHYRDPYAIRALLVLVVFVGIIAAGPDWSQRIRASVSLDLTAQTSPVRMDAWLQPPDYTGLGPQTLSIASDPEFGRQMQGTHFTVPAGTVFSVRLGSVRTAPTLNISGEDIALTKTAEGGYTADAELIKAGPISLRSGGGFRNQWHISVTPDLPPIIAFAESPSGTARQALRILYDMRDDYGITSVTLEIEKSGFPERDRATIMLPATEIGGETVHRTAYRDMAAHPWAGTSVVGILAARDALGQVTTSDPIKFLLPERSFKHSVARNLIAIRKTLYLTPGARRDANRRLQQQALRRSEFESDLTVYTALRTAYWRLYLNEDEDSRYTVMDLLWDVAVYLEDGDIALTETALRNMFEDALRALQDPDRADEFGDLTDQLSRLIEEYLAAQMSQAERQPSMGPQDSDLQSISSNVLARLLQQMRDLAAAGRTEEAMELLSALRDLLENSTASEMSAEAYQQMMEAAKNLDDLEKLARNQQKLMEQTARESMLEALRERLGGESDGLKNLAGNQSELSSMLDSLRKSLDGSPIDVIPQLDQAGAAMENAAEALRSKNGDDALTEQNRALAALDKAAESIESALSKKMAEMRQQSTGGDPLGRPSGANTDRVEIPDAAEMAEAQRLLQKLRDRLSETSRPEDELEYLRRLLRRFQR